MVKHRQILLQYFFSQKTSVLALWPSAVRTTSPTWNVRVNKDKDELDLLWSVLLKHLHWYNEYLKSFQGNLDLQRWRVLGKKNTTISLLCTFFNFQESHINVQWLVAGWLQNEYNLHVVHGPLTSHYSEWKNKWRNIPKISKQWSVWKYEVKKYVNIFIMQGHTFTLGNYS